MDNIGGFGKNSGPAAQSPIFGGFPQPRSPTPPPISRSPRDLVASPSAFESSHYDIRPSHPSAGMPRSPIQSPPQWDAGHNYYHQRYSAQSYQRPPNTVITSSYSPTGIPSKASQTQDFRRTKSPPFPFSGEEPLGNSGNVRVSRAGLASRSPSEMNFSQKQSHPLGFQRRSLENDAHLPINEAELPAPSFPIRGNQSKFLTSSNFVNPLTRARPMIPSDSTSVVTHNSGRKSPVSYADIQVPKRSRSPTLQSTDDNPFEGASLAVNHPQRSASSFPIRSNQSKSLTSSNFINPSTRPMIPSDSTNIVTHNSGRKAPVSYADIQLPKRSRSPTLQATDDNPFEDVTLAVNDLQRPASSFLIQGNRLKSLTSSNFMTRPMIPSESTNIVAHNAGRKTSVSYDDIQVPKRSRSPTLPSTDDDPFEDVILTVCDPQRPSASPPKMRSNGHSSQNRQTSPTLANYNKEVVKNLISFPVAKKTKLPDEVFEEDIVTREDGTNRELEAKAKRRERFKDELNQPMQNDLNVKDQKAPARRQLPDMVERRKLDGDPAADRMGNFSNRNVPPDYESTDTSTIIVGSCLDMCPESERAERGRKGDLDQYERLDGDRNQTSKSLAVKKYTRTAEREAVLIRPMPILQKTMDYLLNLLNQPYDDSFLGLYNFLWDRMRAIRMDLRMQHIFSLGATKMLEQMIRLHIIAMHELCEYTRGEGFSEGFDAHLNIEQMNKTSVELFQLYDDHRKNGVDVVTEKEFRGYYALLKLDKHPGYKVEPAELSLDLAKMTPELRQTPEIVFARDVARACRTGNFIAFFRLARKASYLQACLMHAHFGKLRTQALAALHTGLQNNQGIPAADVAGWLGMEEEDIEELLQYHGFSIRDFQAPFMVKEGPFLNVDSDYPVKCSVLVHRKKSKTIVEDVSHPCLAKSSPPEKTVRLLFNQGVRQKQVPVRTAATDSSQAIDDVMPDFVPSFKDDIKVTVKPTDITVVNQTSMFEANFSPASPSVRDSSSFHDSPRSQLPTVGSPVRDSSSFHDSPRPQLTRVGSSVQGSSPFHDSPRPHLTRTGSYPKSHLARIESGGKSKYDTRFRDSLDRNVRLNIEETSSNIDSEQVENLSFPVPIPLAGSVMQNSVPQHLSSEEIFEEQMEAIREPDFDEMETTSFDQEVAEAKLKLILRIWKRRSSKKKELREQKQLAANAALTSLSLGLPIHRPEIQPSASGGFNLDWFMNKRYAAQEKMWSRLNVSEVVADTLNAKNLDAKCFCWKLLLCTEEDSSYSEKSGKKKEVSHLAASSWLHSKLVPTNVDDDHNGDLAFSSPGLSIWKKWYLSNSSDGRTCYLTVVKDPAKLDNLNEAVAGASAIVFPVSECIPWEFHRNRLQRILTASTFGSRLPLLILSDACKDNSDPSIIIKELGLLNIDKSRISTFFVVFLKNPQLENSNAFFSDERLREGLQWLAKESPPQSDLSWMKTRELVLFHLNSSLEVLGGMDVHKVGPNDCIFTFNQALDQSLAKVTAAVDANLTSWPCPEIALLEELSDEHRAVLQYLPDIGWSSASRIEPLICVLSNSRLPPLEEDISWLYSGAAGANGIETHRLMLQNCLIKYFTESSQMMALPLSTEEASLMLQKFARLELRNSTYYIVPNWVMIFQRVFHWRLMDLSASKFSSAYILSRDYYFMLDSGILNRTYISLPFSSSLVYPSLDEMVEINCMPSTPRAQQLDFEASYPYSNGHEISKTITEDIAVEEEDELNVERGHVMMRKEKCTAIVSDTGDESASSMKATKETDKLSQLLAKCNFVQNMIDDKLSIYF